MRIPDYLTWLLRNLYAGQEATVRTGHGTTDWFQIGKGVRQGCILSLCLFNLYAGFSSVQSLSRVRLFVTPWTVAYQAPLSMGFSRQECWSGLPFPSPGDLPDPGIKPGSPALQAEALPSEPLGNGLLKGTKVLRVRLKYILRTNDSTLNTKVEIKTIIC